MNPQELIFTPFIMKYILKGGDNISMGYMNPISPKYTLSQ